MKDILTDIGFSHFLVLAAVLFAIGTAGVILRRNILIIMMSIELMLNAANLTILTFARMHMDVLDAHDAPIALGAAHTHRHRHEPMRHDHPHFPDAHHRHGHH